ncbi:MAG: hypothetical protein ACERKV_00045 [Clostridiaceae bacterium]
MNRNFIQHGDRFLGQNSNNFMYMHLMFGAIAVVLIIVLVIAIMKKKKKKPVIKNQEAIDILNIRFVKGEISEEDYLKKKEVLKIN